MVFGMGIRMSYILQSYGKCTSRLTDQGQLFSFNPIDGAWDPVHNYMVINYNTFSMAIFGSCIVLDFITLCLPLPVIQSLHMSTRRKWKVACIFWLGILYVVLIRRYQNTTL